MKSLQWLRGWVPKELVQDEFKKLQTHSIVSSACDTCAEQLIPCPHPKATLRDKLMELTKKRTMKPFVLVILLEFLVEFGGAIVWRPYFVQVLKAYGMPMDLNVMMITLGLLSIFGSCFFMVAVKSFGKRLLYLTSTAVVVICSVGLSKTLWLREKHFWILIEFLLAIFRVKVFLVSFSFRRIGHRSKIHGINQFQTSI